MQRYIGMDVHAASWTLAVISETGRKLRDFPVETKRALRQLATARPAAGKRAILEG